MLFLENDENAQSGNIDFYGEACVHLDSAISQIILRLDTIRKLCSFRNQRDFIDHYKTRIKSSKSMEVKLEKLKLPITTKSALTQVFDAAGVRVVCPFVDDVYAVVDALKQYEDIEIVNEKDYISNPKPNGYRSYHIIIRVPTHYAGNYSQVYAEIQLRTIAMDFWASLEHQLKYKKDIAKEGVLVAELKRCADEIASTDLTLQTMRDMIRSLEDKEK